MLKRVLGALLCVLGLVVAGLAVASATVWRASDTLTASATAAPGGTLVMTDAGVLDMAADEVTVRAEADGAPVVVALGRTVDVEAWVGDSPVTRITGLTDRTTLATASAGADGAATPAPTEEAAPEETAPEDAAPEEAAPEETAPEDAASEEAAPEEAAPDETAPEDAAPDPRGSDLWVQEVSGEGSAELTWEAEDGRWSVLVASSDTAVRPTVALSWPQTVTTPWLVPGLVLGGLLLLAGAVLLVLARRRPTDRSVPASPATAPAPVSAAAVTTPSADGRPLTRRELREMQARGTTATRPATGEVPATPAGAARPGPDGGTAVDGTAAPGGDVPPVSGPAAAPAPRSTADDDRRGSGLPPVAGRLGPRRDPAAPPERPDPAGRRPQPAASAWRQTWGLPGGADSSGADSSGADSVGGADTAVGDAPGRRAQSGGDAPPRAAAPGAGPGAPAAEPVTDPGQDEPGARSTDDGGAR